MAWTPPQRPSDCLGARGNFVDYALKVDGELVAFVECRSAGTKLADKHLLQVRGQPLDHQDVQGQYSRCLDMDL